MHYLTSLTNGRASASNQRQALTPVPTRFETHHLLLYHCTHRKRTHQAVPRIKGP